MNTHSLKKLRFILFHKPYDVLSQFTSEVGLRNLSEFNLPKDVYAAGRLDKDSEGLLLLTNDGALIKRLLEPNEKTWKTYLVQVENIPSPASLNLLISGVLIKGKKTLPCKAKLLTDEPRVGVRVPPIRERKNIPTCWLEIKIREGRNRQVRKMTAAIGHPTLRLIRTGIANLKLEGLKEGEFREIRKEEIHLPLNS